jgi:hypothetical protein
MQICLTRPNLQNHCDPAMPYNIDPPSVWKATSAAVTSLPSSPQIPIVIQVLPSKTHNERTQVMEPLANNSIIKMNLCDPTKFPLEEMGTALVVDGLRQEGRRVERIVEARACSLNKAQADEDVYSASRGGWVCTSRMSTGGQ